MDISTGGIRDRLIRDAAATTIKNSLTSLNWFLPGRYHAPIIWRDEAVTEADTEVPLNTLTVSLADVTFDEIELGSLYSEDRHVAYVDFYAEDDDVGRHLMGDIRDILRGKHPSIGRTSPIIQVFNTTEDPVPPDPAFYLEIVNVDVDPPTRTTSRVWEQHWWSIRFELLDER